MCDPLTIAATAFTVLGQVKQGQDANNQAQAQAGQLEYSGRVAQDDALARAQIIRKQGARDLSTAKVAQAASGVVVNEGSGGEVSRQIATDVEHDAHMSILSGERQARGLNTEAAYARQAGENAVNNSMFQAAGTVLSGATSYNRMQGWKTQMKQPTANTYIPMQPGGGY